MKLRWVSITLRLNALFSFISTAILLMLGLLIGKSVENHFIEQDMDLMTGKIRLVANLLEKVQSKTDLNSLPGLLNDSLVGHHSLAMIVVRPDGQTLFSTIDARFPPSLLNRNSVNRIPEPQLWQQATAFGMHPQRGITALLSSGISGMSPLLVAVAVDITQHDHFMVSFRKTLWWFIGLAVVIVNLLGWAIVKHGLAPLKDIRQAASVVTANRLNYRLNLDSFPVELAELAEALNTMLARLEESFQRLKDFSSDLAHELRTPISNLMTQTQVVLTRVRSDEEYREVLASNIEEYERLARMIGDMLFLAQSENGLIVLHREQVDLANVVRELFDYYEALAEEKTLGLVLTGNAQVTGDKLMLQRALANLLSNAIRHSDVRENIEVGIKKTDVDTVITIKNKGEAIPPEHLPHIFDRFYRADPSRHRNSEGAGLGLAITLSIIQAHGGTIHVRSGMDGTCFEIQLN